MFSTSLVAVASLLLSFFPLSEKVEYSIAEISIAKKATLSYSLGQIEIHRSTGAIPLTLMKRLDDNVVMMVSEPFKVLAGDSIYFRRSMSITSSGTKPVPEKSLLLNKFEKTYQSIELDAAKSGVRLHDTLFGKESCVMMITDIMYENDSVIIASLDTITVKRNGNNYIKAFTAPFRPESVKASLKNIDPSRPVVVRTWIQLLLPETSKFAIKTKSQLRDKKAYNIVSINPSMVVPGYGKVKN